MLTFVSNAPNATEIANNKEGGISYRILISLLATSVLLIACGSSDEVNNREVISCSNLSESYENGCPFGECRELSKQQTSCNLYDGFKQQNATRLCGDNETAGYYLQIEQRKSGAKEIYQVIVTCYDFRPFFHHCPTDNFEILMEEEDDKPAVNCEEG